MSAGPFHDVARVGREDAFLTRRRNHERHRCPIPERTQFDGRRRLDLPERRCFFVRASCDRYCPRGVRCLGQVLDDGHRGTVHPLAVFEHEVGWTIRHRFHQFEGLGCEAAGPEPLRDGCALGRVRNGGSNSNRQQRGPRRQVRVLDAGNQCDAGLDGVCVLGDPEGGTHCAADRGVGGQGRVLVVVHGEGRDAGHASDCLVEQPRLAGSGIAHDLHEAAGSIPARIEVLREKSEFRLPADQGEAGLHLTRFGEWVPESDRSDRFLLALDCERFDRGIGKLLTRTGQ